MLLLHERGRNPFETCPLRGCERVCDAADLVICCAGGYHRKSIEALTLALHRASSVALWTIVQRAAHQDMKRPNQQPESMMYGRQPQPMVAAKDQKWPSYVVVRGRRYGGEASNLNQISARLRTPTGCGCVAFTVAKESKPGY